MLCGTSVPELLSGCDADAPSTILTAQQVDGMADPFYGHLALWLDGSPEPLSYPITARTAEQIRRRLEADPACGHDWLVVSTLDNRVLQEAIDHPACYWSVADADAMNARWVVLGDAHWARHVVRDAVRLIELPKMRYDEKVLEAVQAAGLIFRHGCRGPAWITSPTASSSSLLGSRFHICQD